MPRYPVPVVLLARLAVDVTVAGRGLGAWLLRDAMLVHAIDENARSFYVRHGLEPSPSDPMHLMILLKDITTSLRATGSDLTLPS
jgi:hypothetical protein